MPSKYAKEPDNPTKSCKARGSNLRVHFKNTREAAMALKGLSLPRAQKYLEDVLEKKKQIVPFRHFTGGVGRKAQCKVFKTTQGRWPKKSAEFLLGLLKNAQSNAAVKELKPEQLYVSHVQVNQAQQQRRRTYRAHGRINPYMSCPCHIELIFSEKEVPVPKPKEAAPAAADAAKDTKDATATDKKVVKRVSKKKQARERLRAGPA